MAGTATAFANNDIAYIWWRLDARINGCLGFSVRRIEPDGSEKALPAFVGFEPGQPGQPHPVKDTDAWPVQSFQWKDVYAAPGTYRYRIVPMVGNWRSPTAHPTVSLETPDVTIGGDYGNIEAYFNVGLISTQAITRELRRLVDAGTYGNTRDALLGEIAAKGSKVRLALAGDVLDGGLLSLLKKCSGSSAGHCHLALYELTDRELIDAIKALAGSQRLALCLSNADKSEEYTGEDGKKHSRKIVDGTNAEARRELHQAGVPVTDRFVPSSSIGHNKFVVWSDRNGTPHSVLLGSTNWTSTGLCSQTNNALVVKNPAIAQGYRDYWDFLAWDAGQERRQGSDLREWCGGGAVEATVGGAKVSAWFSPNTVRKTKDPDTTPPDLAEVFALIQQARHGVLFLAFNPGSPSFLDQIRMKAAQMEEEGKDFYVRGAVTEPAALGGFATFLTKRRATEAPDVLVSGVAGVPDDYGYWEQELYKLGHAVIHDKIIVIDPFSPDSVVITGSHNLGFKASYQNDENMLIVRGHARLAQAYAAHCLDVTNHFAWRYKLTDLYRRGQMEKAWGDLDETDRWQDKYFRPGSSASRDAFFFAS